MLYVCGEVKAVGSTHNILVILLGSERCPMGFFPSFRGPLRGPLGGEFKGNFKRDLK